MRTICSLALLITLAGCAHGPVVTKIEEDNTLKDQNHQVFYALPRTLVHVDMPVGTQKLQCGLLHWLGASLPDGPLSLPGPCPGSVDKTTSHTIDKLRFQNGELVAGEKCSIEETLNPSDVCALRFRRAELSMGNELFSCQDNVNVVLAGDPSVTLDTVPDPEHIYAVNLKPGLFEKLQLDLELAAGGAPTRLSSMSSSALANVTQTMLGAAAGTTVKGNKIFSLPTSGTQPDQVIVAVKAVMGRILALEAERQAKLREANGQAAAMALAAEQARLRTLIEGGIHTTEQRLRITFDPPDAESKFLSVVTTLEGFDPCGSSPTSAVIARLHLHTDGHTDAWVRRQTPAEGDQGEQGFRYRVPRYANAAIELCLKECPDPRNSGGTEKQLQAGQQGRYQIARALPINQWGTVRSLPRRLGMGAGAVKAALDPMTGALKLIGTEGAGSMQQPFIAAMTEADKDHELSALQREKTELELRKSICENRKNLGLPIPEYCPVDGETPSQPN